MIEKLEQSFDYGWLDNKINEIIDAVNAMESRLMPAKQEPEPKSTDKHANLCLRLGIVAEDLRENNRHPGAATVEEAIAELRKEKK